MYMKRPIKLTIMTIKFDKNKLFKNFSQLITLDTHSSSGTPHCPLHGRFFHGRQVFHNTAVPGMHARGDFSCRVVSSILPAETIHPWPWGIE